MKSLQPLPRRTFLKGLGTAIALPWLEAMIPLSRAASVNAGSPLRMAFLYVPNGVHMSEWTPTTEGSDFAWPQILQPLEPMRDRLQILTGLAHRTADPNGDGPGDHARASASFLTGMQARKTAATNIRAGISIDQVAAEALRDRTRLPSLELGCDKGQQAGSCDSGYSCAYQFNLAWKTDTTPLPPEVDPRSVFERLFAAGRADETAASRERRRARHASVLDFVRDDTRALQRQLSATDRGKLDQYLTAIRELERRVEQADRFVVPPPPQLKVPAVPRDYEEHIRLLFDLLVLAFQTDTTRISTFMLAHDGSNRSYPFVGVSEGHHDLSHHGGNAEKKSKIARINQFHVAQFAYFLQRLESISEGDETLLDHCMVIYGSGISDGNAHSHANLPVLLAGRGHGTLRPGRHVRYESPTPMSNLYLAMLERMGVSAPRFGDSTGPLGKLV